MTTHALGGGAARRTSVLGISTHWTWLAVGFLSAFLVPFVFADTFTIDRDVFYGLYSVFAVALVLSWAVTTGYDLVGALRRHWRWAVGLGLASAAILAAMVLTTEDATSHPHGVDLVAALLWRGVVYGAADGLLLSVFPILAVFAAFAGKSARIRGKIAVGALALTASLAMTAVYHIGYGDFRSAKLRKPMLGDVVWSAPTLLTLNPVGAPIAHAGLHMTAVLHSYDTNLYLPPHK